jgi:hypothetical protein
MRLRSILATFVIALLASQVATAAAPGQSEPVCRLPFDDDPQVLDTAYRNCLRALTTGGGAAGASVDTLYDAVDMLSSRAGTRPDAVGFESLKAVMGELAKRGAVRPSERRSYFGALLSNNLWNEAIKDQQLADAPKSVRDIVLPKRIPLTSARAAGEARFWRWAGDQNTITEASVDLSRGVHLVITSSTHCEFCIAATAEIGKDPAARKAFAEHALWISRPETGIDGDEYLNWNEEHPDLPMVLVMDTGGWPMPALWSTPRFYFISDGKVVKELHGWIPGRLAEVKAEFTRLGVALE